MLGDCLLCIRSKFEFAFVNCPKPQALRASPRLGFLFAQPEIAVGSGLCCCPLSNYPTNSDGKNAFIVAASFTALATGKYAMSVLLRSARWRS